MGSGGHPQRREPWKVENAISHRWIAFTSALVSAPITGPRLRKGLAGIVNEGDRSIDRPTRLFLPSSLRGCMLTRPSLRPPTLAPLIVEAIVTGLAYLQVERGHHDRFGVWVKGLLSRKPKAPRQLALAHRPQSSSPEPGVANQWRYSWPLTSVSPSANA